MARRNASSGSSAPDSLWTQLLQLSTLDAGWARVRANQGAAGGDGMTVAQFQASAPQRIARLAAALQAGRYRPGPTRRVAVPKRKGGVRVLTIPAVTDRVVQAALAIVLTPILDAQFEEASFAYRPGRSVKQALEAVARWRDLGFWHVVEADIVGFFDHVRHDLLLDKLEAALRGQGGAQEVTGLVGLMLEFHAAETGVQGRGLPQGSPLSPLLSNLYLDALDERLDGRGLRLVRFADDFVILAKQRESAEAALADCARVLSEHGLELNPEATRLRDFDRGFEFLGGLFVRSMVLQALADPEEEADTLLRIVAQDDAREAEDEAGAVAAGHDRGARVLYLLEAGRRLGLRNRSFTVLSPEGAEIAGIAHSRLDRIEIGAGTSAEFEALDLALATGKEVVFLDGTGAARGWLTGRGDHRAGLQFAQARAMQEGAFAAAYARALVDARIRNQRTQLFRLNRDPAHPQTVADLAAMERLRKKLLRAGNAAEARGYEGAVAALYWPALGRMVAAAPQPFRRVRPAEDPFNATINYLAAILERDLQAAVLAAGLHPGFGALHAPRDGAQALVYDLMEPFRAPLTEGLAAFLFNARRLRPEMFVPVEGGVRLLPEARGAIVKGYETAVARVVNAPGRAVRLAWRAMMKRQAQDLAQAVRAGDPALFRPYLMEP